MDYLSNPATIQQQVFAVCYSINIKNIKCIYHVGVFVKSKQIRVLRTNNLVGTPATLKNRPTIQNFMFIQHLIFIQHIMFTQYFYLYVSLYLFIELISWKIWLEISLGELFPVNTILELIWQKCRYMIWQKVDVWTDKKVIKKNRSIKSSNQNNFLVKRN